MAGFGKPKTPNPVIEPSGMTEMSTNGIRYVSNSKFGARHGERALAGRGQSTMHSMLRKPTQPIQDTQDTQDTRDARDARDTQSDTLLGRSFKSIR